MTPEALAFLTVLGEFGGVASNALAMWDGMASGILTCVSEGWVVSADGSYRMTQAGETALYAGLTA